LRSRKRRIRGFAGRTTARRRLTLSDREPRKERPHALALIGGHVFEVPTAIDDFPKILARDALELLTNREETIARFVLHVPANGPRLLFLSVEQVIARELHLRLAHAEESPFLALRQERLVELEELGEHFGLLRRAHLIRDLA